jgi:hypothetical protein
VAECFSKTIGETFSPTAFPDALAGRYMISAPTSLPRRHRILMRRPE